MLVSIITPFFNEARTLATCLERVRQAALPPGMTREFVVVDDGATDASAGHAAAFVAAHPAEARLVRLPDNRGKGAAMRAGLAVARGDVIVVQDADLEWDPADYVRLLEPYGDPRVTAVFGSRLLGHDADCIYYHYYLGGRLLSACTNLLFGSGLTDQPTGMKSFRRSALDGTTLVANGFDFDAELVARLLQRGHSIVEIPVHYRPRSFADGKKVRARDGLRALWVLARIRLEGRQQA